jgi:hypothetical protein
MMAATTGHIIYFGNIYCMTRLLFFQFHKFWLPCHGKNNRSESLSGHLPKLELEYLEVLLFLVAAVTECYVKKKKVYPNAPILLQDTTLQDNYHDMA